MTYLTVYFITMSLTRVFAAETTKDNYSLPIFVNVVMQYPLHIMCVYE